MRCVCGGGLSGWGTCKGLRVEVCVWGGIERVGNVQGVEG